jgi:hypothetical protein
MKLQKANFEDLLAQLKRQPGAVYVPAARFFFAKKKLDSPIVEELVGADARSSGGHPICTTINGKTQPIERGIIGSMIPQKDRMREVDAAMDSIVGKPLEVLAKEIPEPKAGRYQEWQIWMLRDGTDAGFVHDELYQEILIANCK